MNSNSITLPSRKSLLRGFSPETIQVLALLTVAVVAVSPILFYGFPSNQDLSNHFRFALPFYEALRSGHLYPGWLAESNNGFGDASFRFYPPGLYYLLALARTLTGNWYAATSSTFVVLSMAGALGVYLWAREFASSTTAMWAAIFYSVAPYHLNQLFQALLLAEFAAAAVLPFAFLFAERVCRHRRARDIAGLSGAYALLVLTHLPLAVTGSIALAFYAFLRLDRKKFAHATLALAGSVALGLGASACYWITMVSELNWIRADNVNPVPGQNYRDNFVLSTFSADQLNVWWMNILLLSMAAMFWPAVVLFSRSARSHEANSRDDKSLVPRTGAVALLALLTLAMATPLSRPLWDRIHPLQETQFPWRWFAISSMVLPLLLALSIPFWTSLMKTPKRPLVMLAAGTMAISLAFSIGHIIREARWVTPAQFEQILNGIPGSRSVYQWLPVWVHDELPQMHGPVEVGDRTINVINWTAEKRTFQVSAGAAGDARIKTFFYPLWTATAGGRNLATHPDQDGALMVSVPGEATAVTLEFREPSRVRYAARLTLISWIFIAGLFFKRRPWRAKQSPRST
ncbi:MAG: 6-pyruvoyl-tetrahydropterin synthase-related protein [Pyrinomonadaceae bacterium]